ncbi:eCIS core domain-containing protein [Bradyrhizobium sp. 2S1]|uniref:eCIS core domain-containing protein n=1 Tax=Bradyrhizobium sp. 2S1 TaxID=1404429 RepID=UPI001407BFED|nr:DUF4157 domain-containing protein [Bradyrhizobium sp. 2S1]MCK7668298.1 DUF4157 domain-containing protein [Bradyrhizobium sp. 2S1]
MGASRDEPEAGKTTAASVNAAAPRGLLQRKCACGTHTMAGNKCEACERTSGPLQRKATNQGASGAVPSIVHDVLRSSGQPLDAATRAFTEPRVGHDFSGVRVHSGPLAAASAKSISAHAYTVGRDVVVGHNTDLNSRRDRELLGHELAHVVQQGGQAAPASSDLPLTPAASAAEREADIAAAAVSAGGSFRPHTAGVGVARQKDAGALEPGDAGVPDAGAVAAGAAAGAATGVTRKFSLTFDDGPHAAKLGTGANRTEKVLDTLKGKSIKAGFFIQTAALDSEGHEMRGGAPAGKALVKRMAAEGHKVAVHTGGKIDHQVHTSAAKAGSLKGELESAKNYIEAQTGTAPDWVRPPKGKFDKSVEAIYAAAGLTNVLWDMDGDRGEDLSLAVLKGRIESEMQNVQRRGWKPTTPSPNIIVLYHDIQKGTASNLEALIDHIEATTAKISGGKDKADFVLP